jgi:DNA-directed RNA polymerase subunit alpha
MSIIFARRRESDAVRPPALTSAIHLHGRDPMPRIPYKDLTQSDEMAEKLEMSTAEIGLSVRTTNCLEERGIFTVHDLLNCTRTDLLSISNFGEKTLEEVYKALEKIGFFRVSRPSSSVVVKPSEPVAHAS